jgi:alpha-glucosidase
MTSGRAWVQDAVVYQVYPRSFQDSNGDGEGDLRGIAARLDHIARLGADAVWLSPIYPSPFADGGYDVADYEDVDPRFGTVADAEALIAAAHERGLRLLLDAVPCHTSIEHRWFREHPDWYVWSPVDGPANNWLGTFGGRAWSPDPDGRGWYLHSFYREQPDLDWRNPAAPEAFGRGLRFWLDRGVDGFRVDAIDRVLKDPELRDDPPASGPSPLFEHGEVGTLEHRHSRNAPDVGVALAQLRAAAGDDAVLIGEAYLPSGKLGPYLEHLDACFSFDLLQAGWSPEALRAAIGAAPERAAWVLSNHDFSRLPDRVGVGNARAAALLLLTLPGPAFVFQGDELGQADGPGRTPPDDRAGRDRHRHPMAWDESRRWGFTAGDPWLPVERPAGGTVAEQERDPDSMLHLYRRLIARRRDLRGPVELLEADEGLVTFRRGEHLVALNATDEPRPAPRSGDVVLRTGGDSPTPRALGPGEGLLARACPQNGRN